MTGALNKPLRGVRILEFEGIGPCPVAGRLLGQLGASVTLIARPAPIEVAAQLAGDGPSPIHQGKEKIVIDLRAGDDARDRVLGLVAQCDVVLEGLRPGVMERLGLGPGDCSAVNQKVVYARMTGWGQDGCLKDAAGHDLNYVALSGLLSLSARKGQLPIIPPAAIGDVAGAMNLVCGIVCALFDIRGGGAGRVVDGAVVDAAIGMGVLAHWLTGVGQVGGPTPSVFHDSPFYDVYECADGKQLTVGALEPKFYAELLQRLGLDGIDPGDQYDRSLWPDTKRRFAALFRTRTRDAWCALLEGADVCFAPVLTVGEAQVHPHNTARGSFTTEPGVVTIGRLGPRFLPL